MKMNSDLNSAAGDGPRDCGPFFLDVIGHYGPESVETQWLDDSRPTNPDVDALIEQAWQDQTSQASQDDRCLYDGKLCRLIDLEADEQRLSLTLGAVSYKEFMGTNLTNAHLRYRHGPEVLANPLGVSAAVVTQDEYVLLGRRSEWVAHHAGKIHPLGGMVEPQPAGGAADPFETILTELTEETGLPREAFGSPVCLGLVRDKRIVQPELVFELTVDRDVETIRRVALDAPDALEHTELVCVRNHPAATVTFIERNFADLTPVSLATLLLHGQTRWGSGWFAAARGYLRRVI